MAVRSPFIWMRGPAVARKRAFISFAMTDASVVLPKPGGPYNKMWSRGSPRFRAASIATSRLSLTCCCPMYSARTRGRSDNSNGASSSITEPAITRFAILRLCQNLQRAFEQDIEGCVAIPISRPLKCAVGKRPAIAEILECRQNVHFHRRLLRLLGKVLQLVPEFQNDSLGGFFSDAGNRGEPSQIAPLDRPDKVLNRTARKNRYRQLWADAGNH